MISNMNHLFIPYNESLKLKELGFDDPYFASYDSEGEDLMTNNDGSLGKNSTIKYGVYSPLYQQAVDWLYKKYAISISLDGRDSSEERLTKLKDAIRHVQNYKKRVV